MKKTLINNRRYLGNKYKLLPFIKDVVEKECIGINTIADLFSGTGSVSSAFADKQLITNDLLYSNYISNIAWFSSQKISKKKIEKLISDFNKIDTNEENYMTINFSNTYFNYKDCSKIGFIRESIEDKFTNGEINFREKAVLITSLLYAMDKIANTVGHYDAYFQNGYFEKSLELSIPMVSNKMNAKNKCFNEDANKLVDEISADLVYLDPPYNSRQYSDAYHLLENVAKWEKPEVFGVAKKMDRKSIKSKYCTSEATKSFRELIQKIDAKYILLSYNNMSNKGNDRSNAKISDEDIISILSTRGEVKIFEFKYKPFTTGKSNNDDNIERLFLCKCTEQGNELISSPLNYTGGKFRIISQIMKHFPNDIDTFVDLFCGGCNVGINVKCNKLILNDINKELIELFKVFKQNSFDYIFDEINNLIIHYGLSQSSVYGYIYYQSNSSDGLGDYNRNQYLKLRDDFNQYNKRDDKYYLMLYVLIVYSFNNQIRFNKKGKFNLPVGKRDFNVKMQNKLLKFINRLHRLDSMLMSNDFLEFDISALSVNSFVYIDPPYLITLATYNEQNGWTENHERNLLKFIDRLDSFGIKFALSNVIESKGISNDILKEWLSKRSKYKLIDIESNYTNSSYQIKDKTIRSKEVLIINY